MDADRSIEFHTINGGSKGDLVACVSAFFLEMAKTADQAITFYDNEKIHSVFPLLPVTVLKDRIDGGIGRTFSAVFNLRERKQ